MASKYTVWKPGVQAGKRCPGAKGGRKRSTQEEDKLRPSLTEWQVSAGIWAFGLMIFTIALKIAVPIFLDRPLVPHR